MSTLESFGMLLSETVAGDKLSTSKVERVRDSAAKQFHRGEKACSIIVKVHRKAATRTKLSSLYLFDAISRHAADIVRKRGSGYNYDEAQAPSSSKAENGTKKALLDSASSFLRYANNVVEEIVIETMHAVREDQKGKVIKVVDIWVKANTFDEDLLMRVKGKLMIASKEGNTSITKEGSNQDGPTSIPSPYGMLMSEEKPSESAALERTNTPPHLPSSLLALLGGNKNAIVDAKQNGSAEAQKQLASLDESQMAMLQKIAQQNKEPEVSRSPPQQQQEKAEIPSRPTPVLPVSSSTTTTSNVSSSSAAINASAGGHSDHDELATFVPNQSIGDLSQFDMMQFDPTNASHWIRFAQHWYNSFQYIPSNQELMFAMMTAMQSQAW